MRFTLKEGKYGTICATCKHGTVTTTREGIVFTHCNQIRRTFRNIITTCTAYEEDRTMSLYDMRRIGYELDLLALKKGKPGFIKPDSKRLEQIELVEDDVDANAAVIEQALKGR